MWRHPEASALPPPRTPAATTWNRAQPGRSRPTRRPPAEAKRAPPPKKTSPRPRSWHTAGGCQPSCSRGSAMDGSTRRRGPTSGAGAAAHTWQHGALTPAPKKSSWTTCANARTTTTRYARPNGSRTLPPCRGGKTDPAARRPVRPEGTQKSARRAADGRHRRSCTPRTCERDGPTTHGCRRPAPPPRQQEARRTKASRRPTNRSRAAPAAHPGRARGTQDGQGGSMRPGTPPTTPRTGGRSGPPQPQGTREEPRQSRPARRRTAPAPAADMTVKRQNRLAAAPRANPMCPATAHTASAHRKIGHAACYRSRHASTAGPGGIPTRGAPRLCGDTRLGPRDEMARPRPGGRGGGAGDIRRSEASQGPWEKCQLSSIRSHLRPS